MDLSRRLLRLTGALHRRENLRLALPTRYERWIKLGRVRKSGEGLLRTVLRKIEVTLLLVCASAITGPGFKFS